MSNSNDLFISTSKGRDESVVDYLNNLFLWTVQSGISDVHLEASSAGWNIRIRNQGKLEEIGKTTKDLGEIMAHKIRSRASMEAMDRGQTLDGRFSLVFRAEGLAADVRVSVMPTERGQSIVCRVLDQRNATRDFRTIEMTDAVSDSIRLLIDEPDGLFLVTGPTGSGKTSTLYSIIGELNTPERKILTIEDPVEYQVPGLQQVPVGMNNSFAEALRAALRQDPDVILVGEIRDAETARVAVQAASTGHLVLSTLHTNDAASSIMRMIDLGVDAFTLGTSLRGVLAQRLVSAIAGSPSMVDPTPDEKLWLHSQGVKDVDSKVAVPKLDADLQGRIPIMELIMVDDLMRAAMSRNDLDAIKAAAKDQKQYLTLTEAGVDMCRRGRTTLGMIRSISSNIEDGKRRKLIGEIMVAEGYVTPRQLEKALAEQIDMGSSGKALRIGEIVVSMGFCSEEEVDRCVGMQS